MLRVVFAALLLLLATACGPANDRPVRGAVPGSAAPTAPGVPPTLTASEALRQRGVPSPEPAQSPAAAAPGPSAAPAPTPSAAAAAASPSVVAQSPIVRTIVPAANGHVPANAPVAVSAVLVGRTADLASASLSLNGADIGAEIDKRSPRDWTIHSSQKLATGTQTVKVLVKDANGTAGGFTWQFSVGDAQPTATPAP